MWKSVVDIFFVIHHRAPRLTKHFALNAYVERIRFRMLTI
jgi:hypothetical protein